MNVINHKYGCYFLYIHKRNIGQEFSLSGTDLSLTSLHHFLHFIAYYNFVCKFALNFANEGFLFSWYSLIFLIGLFGYALARITVVITCSKDFAAKYRSLFNWPKLQTISTSNNITIMTLFSSDKQYLTSGTSRRGKI